eukprot:10981930-Lingulodinium_polyedra.AAC.1
MLFECRARCVVLLARERWAEDGSPFVASRWERNISHSWGMCGGCVGHVGQMNGTCLEHVFGHLRRMFGACLGHI